MEGIGALINLACVMLGIIMVTTAVGIMFGPVACLLATGIILIFIGSV